MNGCMKNNMTLICRDTARIRIHCKALNIFYNLIFVPKARFYFKSLEESCVPPDGDPGADSGPAVEIISHNWCERN